MSRLHRNPVATLIFGIAIGAAVVWSWPRQELTAATANGNDMFTMVTVPTEGGGIGETEAVFILDHLTGILRGGKLNNTTGAFSHQYVYNVAADFQVGGGGRNAETKYAVVSGPAQIGSTGRSQPARGVIYIAEKNSGAVIAYGFALPRGQGSATPLPVQKLAYFSFREPLAN